MSHADAQQIAKHLFATIGSLTERGGRVTGVTSRATIAGLGLARVGDTETCKDGSKATIIDGAGFALSTMTSRLRWSVRT